MGKDPAFLFYSDNFQSGTQFFTDEQTGKYIRLLCAQHLHGHLTEKQVLLICKTDDADTKEILAKFCKDEDGNYYNKRLEIEVEKRRLFSESRANNRLGKTKKQVKNTRKTSVKHLEDGNGNGNEDNNGVKLQKKIIPSIEEFLEHGKEICKRTNSDFTQYKFSFESKYEAWKESGWKDGHKQAIKNWKSKLSNTFPHMKPIRSTEQPRTW